MADCQRQAKATYWSVLLALVALGVLCTTLLGDALAGIAILAFTLPGVLAQLRMASQTMKTWHLGGCACWLAYSVYRVVLLVKHPSAADTLQWLVYAASLALCALALLLALAIHVAADPRRYDLRKRLPRSAALMGGAQEAPAAAPVEPEAGTSPLVWPPGSTAEAAAAWPPSDFAIRVDPSAPTDGEGSDDRAGAAVWPPPGYTGN